MNPETLSSWSGSWQMWAVLSAVFAALTAIFAKIGVEDINPDLATFIRTVIVLASFAVILFATGQFSAPGPISRRTWTFLVLSGLATGASWLCYFRALKLGPATLVAPDRQAERGSGRAVRLRVSRRAPVCQRLARDCVDCRRRSSSRREKINQPATSIATPIKISAMPPSSRSESGCFIE